MNNRPRHVLFDLDGTLVDTAPDMAAALNRLLLEQNRQPLDFEIIRPIVSHGGAALVTLAFPDATAEQHAASRQRFLALYAEQLQVASHLFSGMHAVIAALAANRRYWGIVTNKPAWLAQPLVEALIRNNDLPDRGACLVCGDEVASPKPAPDALLRACELTGWEPQECVYVGDARRDIDAAHAAGMAAVAAAYGYLATTEDAADWQADGVINAPTELLDWLQLCTH